MKAHRLILAAFFALAVSSEALAQQGAINPQTGQWYPEAGQGAVDPATGAYFPKAGKGGAVDPATGAYYPLIKRGESKHGSKLSAPANVPERRSQ